MDARRNAGGTGSGTAPRESGAAITRDSNPPIALSRAASPIGSGASHASAAAVAAFLTPSRWKLLKITARSMGEAGELWKNPSRSSPSETIAGAGVCAESLFSAIDWSFQALAWLPFPEMKNGDLSKMWAMPVNTARSTMVPGMIFQQKIAVTAAAISTIHRRWSVSVTVRKSADRAQNRRERGFEGGAGGDFTEEARGGGNVRAIPFIAAIFQDIAICAECLHQALGGAFTE